MPQITTTSQKRIDQLLVGLVFIGIMMVLFSLSEENWNRIAIGVLLVASSALLLHSRIKNRVETFADKLMGQMEFIEDISSTGFKVKKLKDQSTSLHQWRDISEVILKDESDLIFKFHDNKEKIFKNSTGGYYRLLKNIPEEKLIDSRIKNYQRTTFENLTTCVTCGFIAYKATKCLACSTDSFETAQFVEAENESDYLREEQLEYFSTMDKAEPIEFYPKKEEDEIFEFDKNWKPIVTEEEVLAFSKEAYWD